MAPLLSPASGLAARPSPVAEGPTAGAGTVSPERPLSEGAKLKYTVPNPAIAATVAATR
jgi:hypothetical protein